MCKYIVAFMLGISFARFMDGLMKALSGELSYRQVQPVDISKLVSSRESALGRAMRRGSV